MKFNIVGKIDRKFYGAFNARNQKEADDMVARWSAHHRLDGYVATEVDTLNGWIPMERIETRADDFMEMFRADNYATWLRTKDALDLSMTDLFRGVETVYGPKFDHSFDGVDRSHWSGLGCVVTHCGHGFWRDGVFVRPAQGGYRAQLKATLDHVRQ